MKIAENFIREILVGKYPEIYQEIYDGSFLLQYLDNKMKAVHGDCTTRRSLANIYAIYSIAYFYRKEFCNSVDEYKKFEGYEYMQLLAFMRRLYCGGKLQNHALNSRVNGEFRNKFRDAENDLIIVNNGKYLLHIDYLYVNNIDISDAICEIVEKYINLLREKDNSLISTLHHLQTLQGSAQKKYQIKELLVEDAEARVFEIISFAILKNHYKNIKIYWGYSMEHICEEELQLFKTGRTNANDGGIDFVLRPLGRFFQVTEVGNYDKYLLDIDKVMHFPITFVIKTLRQKQFVLENLEEYIAHKTKGMKVLESRYREAIEEIITINELKEWIDGLDDSDINNIIRDIDIFYRLEMNFGMEEDDEMY